MENNVKSKILSLLKIRGPSLPVHLSKQVQISLIFTGAFLSEMAREKSIKISNMKVGGSPLYYLSGQENMLERFYTYLPDKEKQSFLLLKQNKILKDDEQEPAIRFALRQIKDFALPFSKDNELFWRFYSVTEQEVREILKEEKVVEKKEIKKKIKPEEKQKKEKLLIKLKEPRQKKTKEKSWFVLRVEEFLKQQDIEILEEIGWKKREYVARVRINSDLDKIEFFCLAKDKKSITENDLTLALKKAQDFKLPALVISKADLNKKAKTYLEEWGNLIKFRRI